MTRKRDVSIDRFRGFVIISTIILQIWKDFDNLEFLSRLGNHSVSHGFQIFEGLQFIDVFAPMFLFAIALTYKKSFNNRCIVNGSKGTFQHFIIRNISLIGIGGIIRGIESFIYYLNNGFVENKIDYIFFAAMLFLLIIAILTVIGCLKSSHRMKKIFSNLLVAIVGLIAFLCAVSAGRDFFVQIVYPENYDFKPWGYWEALQAIGAAGLVTMLFIKYSSLKRFVVASVFFVIYIILHETGNCSTIISVYAQQGGFLGVIGQTCILMFGTVLADLYNNSEKNLTKYFFTLQGFGIASGIMMQYILPTMRSVSPSYILLNVYISGSLYMLVWAFRNLKIKFDLLEMLGKNCLSVYILQYVLIYGTKELIGYDVLKSASDIFAMMFTILMVSILSVFVYVLNKKNIIIKL